jgi:tetratricopeptide (TPR) repeat protein
LAKIKLTAMQKKLFIGIIAGVVLLALGLVLWLKVYSPEKPTEEGSVPAEVSLNSVGSQAATYVASGEVDKALTHYDEQINITQDDREKKSLLIKKAITATDIGRYDEAIASAKQADEIESDTQTMRVLADAYAANGDKEEALTYYRRILALEKSIATTEDARPNMQFGPSLETIIKELES